MRSVLVVSDLACAAESRGRGSLLERLVAESALPVMLMRKPVARPARHILVAVDPVDLARGTLERVCRWLEEMEWAGAEAVPATPRVELEVLHVSRGLQEWREAAPAFDREVRGVEELAWKAGVRVSRSVRWGAVPARRIVEAAALAGSDLVILGLQGADRADTWQWVAARAPCNVLLFPSTTGG